MNLFNPFIQIRSGKSNGILILLNIFGLALGLASVIYIAIWIRYEISFDRFHENAKRIYRIESLLNFGDGYTVWQVAPAPAVQSVMNDFPEVVKAVAMQKGYNTILTVGDQVSFESNLYYTTPGFFDLFSFRLLKGYKENILSEPNSIVISQSMASRYFGNVNPIGETILLNNKNLLTITGIIEDAPANSHLRADFLVPLSLLMENGNKLDDWQQFDILSYIMLSENTDPEKFNQKIVEYLPGKVSNTRATLFLNPLTRIHLYKDPGFSNFSNHSSQEGPITRVYLFTAIGLMLLLLACINFINLATATATKRAKEVGIRKVAGAGRGTIMIQMFAESLFQTFAAMILAIIIVLLFLPAFVKITGLEPGTAEVFDANNIFIALGLMIITGILAGTYPALVLSSFDPVKVLKHSAGNGIIGSGIRKILVVIQFILSTVFIFCILIMNRQISFMQDQDPGFDKESVMVVTPAQVSSIDESVPALASEIDRLPGIEKVAIGGNVPVRMGNYRTFNDWEGNLSSKSLRFHMMQVDDNYLDLLGIKLISGRQFYKNIVSNEVIINESAVKKMGITDPVGKWIKNGDSRSVIVGIVKDFHFRKLDEEINPVYIYKDNKWWKKLIFIKLGEGNKAAVISRITDMIKKEAPEYPVSYSFLDEEVSKYYEGERRLESLLNTATMLSIIISCIGLFGLSAFIARKRQKEIGLRKVNGATTFNLITLLAREFLVLILISSFIALPVGNYIMTRWLETYAYHISIRPVYFILTFFTVAAIAIGTVVLNTLRAARLNPVDTLREE